MMFGKKETYQPKNAPKAESFKAEIKDKGATIRPKKEKKAPSARKTAVTSFLTSIIDGTILTRNWMIKMLPFLMFLVLLAIIYIGNQYAALRRVKEIELISNELKELRNEHISTKSELMYQKRMSEVARKLETTGIRESNTPPVKIYIKKSAK